MDGIAPMVVLTVMALTVGNIARNIVVNRRMREIARTNAELQGKLLDRLSSASDLQAYLDSDAGRSFVEAAMLEKANPHGRILASIQAGILLVLGGLALLVASGQLSNDGPRVFQVLGILGIFLGVGFLASAYVAHRLSQQWGLLPAGPPSGGAEDRAG